MPLTESVGIPHDETPSSTIDLIALQSESPCSALGARHRDEKVPLSEYYRDNRWLAMVESGKVRSLREFARKEGVDSSYVSRMVNLASLAPLGAVG